MSVFQFGERLPEYGVAVLNERGARAGAGILFFVAIVAFMNAWLAGDFSVTKLIVTAFLIDFSVRVFVNPKFAPSLIVEEVESIRPRSRDGLPGGRDPLLEPGRNVAQWGLCPFGFTTHLRRGQSERV